MKDKNRRNEIIRFLIIGLAATILDYLTKTLTLQAMGDAFDSWLKNLISVACGFTVGVVFNYIFSVIWVFKDIDNKEDSRSAKGGLLFLFLGLIGLFINYGIMELGNLITVAAFGISIIDLKIVDVIINLDIGNATFWLYSLTFCVATLVVLVYNYLSRKKFIFKKTKDKVQTNEGVVDK